MNDKRSDCVSEVQKPSRYLTSWTPTSSVLRSYENSRSQRPVREVCVCVFDVMPLMLLHCTHQGVEHQRVIGVLLRGLHHDVEQGVQSVLQKLCVKQKQLQKLHHSKKRDAIFDFYRRAHFDDLASLDLHQPLQILVQIFGVRPPVQQAE